MLANGNLALCDVSPNCNQGKEKPAWESNTLHAGAYALLKYNTRVRYGNVALQVVRVQAKQSPNYDTEHVVLWSSASDGGSNLHGGAADADEVAMEAAVLSIDAVGNVRLIVEAALEQLPRHQQHQGGQVLWETHTDLTAHQGSLLCKENNVFFVHIPNCGGGNAVEAAMAPSCRREDRYSIATSKQYPMCARGVCL